MITHTIITEKMVYGGNCITKINGKTVFIPFSIPNEKINIQITETHTDYDIAEIVEIIEPSPYRTKPKCLFYTSCGGCNMMHIDSSYQTELRKNILKDCFAREGIEVPEITAITGHPFGYRNRFQLIDGGLSMRKGNVVVNLDNCPIAAAEINAYLKNIPQKNRPNGRIHVFGGQCLVNTQDNPAGTKIVIEKPERQAGKNQNDLKTKRKRHEIKKQYAGPRIENQNKVIVKIKDKTLFFDVRGFFQSNIEVLEKMIDIVTGEDKGKNVLDMYSGVGTFSVFLSDFYEKVYMVEHNRDALVYAEQNMADRVHESYGISGENWIKYNAESISAAIGEFDQVVIDPPRSGMEKAVCNWLCTRRIPRIHSVSCNPSTHARDATKLIQAGYQLKKLYLADFYPQTSSIESIACFEYGI